MMGQHIVDFLVHVDQSLAPDAKRQLEDHVREQPCVVSAGVSPQHAHLLLVAYDADCGHARDILLSIQDEGYRAEAIGF
jgi:hypothetical protein